MKRRLFSAPTGTKREQRRELDDEIEAHLQLRADDLEAQGLSPEEARAEALSRFGDLEAARKTLAAETARRDLRLSFAETLDAVRRDLTVTWRRMGAKKARASMLLAVYALGIGATTAMFTVVDNVLLRSLPFEQPGQLVELQSVTEQGEPFFLVSMGNWWDWRQQSRALQASGLYRSFDAAVSSDGPAARVPATEIGGGFFEALRPRMVLGRPLTETDGNEPIVVVSESYWQRFLGGDRHAIGRSLSIDGREFGVVGVVARGFEMPRGSALWLARGVRPGTGADRNNINYRSIARLSSNVSPEAAKLELDRIAEGIRKSDPAGIYSWGVGVVPLRQAVVGDTAETLKILMGSVLLLLVVACVNLMGLTLAEGRERSSEVAVRLALGAGRRRLVQQLVTEQLVYGLLGGALGLALAYSATRWTVARIGDVLPRAEEVQLDGRVAALGIVLSLVAGLVSGLLPALQTAGGRSAGFLSRSRLVQGGRGLPGAPLVVIEVALTVILLLCGGLLVRSLAALVDRDLGFDAAEVVTLDVNLTTPGYFQDPSKVTDYWDRLLARLASVPGVESVAAGTGIPTGSGGATFISLPGDPRTEIGARYRVVSDDYFETLGIGLLQGRTFGPEDAAAGERTVVINRSMAESFWPDGEALGQQVRANSMENYWYGGEAPWLRVVGVVDDIRQFGFEDDLEPAMFTLYRQIPQMAMSPAAVVRVRAARAELVEALEASVQSLDPELAVAPGLLEARLQGLLSERKLATSLLMGLAAIALVLASLGLYGLLAFAVTVRTRELALRAALGAQAAELVALVLRSALVVVSLGAMLGALGVLGVNSLLESLLVDVSVGDPLTYLFVAALLLVVALTAVLAPAAKAARMDPAQALRLV
ncbi:MAG: ADOP family duplicated permease [Acidobacteriota bacterium]